LCAIKTDHAIIRAALAQGSRGNAPSQPAIGVALVNDGTEAPSFTVEQLGDRFERVVLAGPGRQLRRLARFENLVKREPCQGCDTDATRLDRVDQLAHNVWPGEFLDGGSKGWG
jgi:hypothetical protein